MKPRLCLNMIVKNEAARIERCLKSVVDYIDCYVIVDTGSTDATPKIIEDFFKARGIPGAVQFADFVNFGQARNAALTYARKAQDPWTYLFLVDADMEFRVEDKNWRDNLTEPSYDIIQRAGTLSYLNRRLVRRDQTGIYLGVTHEYLDVPGSWTLKGVWFHDHADGANRPDKFKRDIRLLLDDLRTNPKNERSWFYLGQSYRDAGDFQHAAAAYKKRIELGGWDEEVWNSRVNYAHCLMGLKNEGGFIREMLAAYNFRPSRAESLYDLAHYYREKGMNAASLLFSERGLQVPYPGDSLFINDHVYKTGLREEFAISAFYVPDMKERGFSMCNELALDRTIPPESRELARTNLFHYLEPLAKYLPSFSSIRLKFTPPDGYIPMNPSIVNFNGEIVTVIRTVNYTIDELGRYLIRGTNGEANGTNPIHTRNFLVRLNDKFTIWSKKEILPPVNFPAPAWNMVIGFEDMRLFEWNGSLWTNSCIREMNPSGTCEQILAHVSENASVAHLDQWKRIVLPNQQHEKNWMPQVVNNKLLFHYRLANIINTDGTPVYSATTSLALDHVSGGSQLIPCKGGWLALVHEARPRPDGSSKRYYQHRFVWFDSTNRLQRVSHPFVFHDKEIEFCAGLAWHPDYKRLLISYGVADKEAWIAIVDSVEVMDMVFHA